MHAAVAAGINLFDTSPFYGGEKAETVRGTCGTVGEKGCLQPVVA